MSLSTEAKILKVCKLINKLGFNTNDRKSKEEYEALVDYIRFEPNLKTIQLMESNNFGKIREYAYKYSGLSFVTEGIDPYWECARKLFYYHWTNSDLKDDSILENYCVLCLKENDESYWKNGAEHLWILYRKHRSYIDDILYLLDEEDKKELEAIENKYNSFSMIFKDVKSAYVYASASDSTYASASASNNKSESKVASSGASDASAPSEISDGKGNKKDEDNKNNKDDENDKNNKDNKNDKDNVDGENYKQEFIDFILRVRLKEEQEKDNYHRRQNYYYQQNYHRQPNYNPHKEME